MRRVLPGGATLRVSNRGDDERLVACRPLAAVLVRTRPGPAFFPCPQCKASVSTRAESCPHCGCPLDSLYVPVAATGPTPTKKGRAG